MDIAWYRDLVICVWGLVFTVVVILFGVLACLLYVRVRAILNSVRATSANVHEISTAVKDEIVGPLASIGAIIKGISEGIDVFSRFFRKKEGEKYE